MLVVHVFVHVKPEFIEQFASATLENARKSILEPGIARFDVMQQEDDPERFLLTEVYRSVDATAAHKQTLHYQKWRDTVADMMAESRSSLKYQSLFPDEEDW